MRQEYKRPFAVVAWDVVDVTGEAIAHIVRPVPTGPYQEADAEAKRIATLFSAAPDLLKACKAIVEEIDASGTARHGHAADSCPCSYCQADAAIAKATAPHTPPQVPGNAAGDAPMEVEGKP